MKLKNDQTQLLEIYHRMDYIALARNSLRQCGDTPGLTILSPTLYFQALLQIIGR